MDNYTIFLMDDKGKKVNITELCSNLAWKDSIETLGMEFSFDIARNSDDRFLSRHEISEIGDKVLLMNGSKEIFRGIITDVNTERYKKSFAAFDYAFYLNKNKMVIQFRKINASKAIDQLCKKFSIPVGKITSISTVITKIYKDDTLADIIRDILYQAKNELGIKYRLEMRLGKLYIEKYTDLIISPTFQLASNLKSFNVLDAIGSISKSESIQDMKNSIVIASNSEKSSSIFANSKDENSIKKFGLLQDVETLDKKQIGQARNVAKNKLNELNKIHTDISLDLLGDDSVRSGRILKIKNAIFGLDGQYLVKDCTHTYQNSIHKMNLNVEKV